MQAHRREMKALTDTDVLSRISARLQQTDKNLWGKIKDFLKGLVDRLKAAYKGMNPDSSIAQLARQSIQSSENALNAFADAASDAIVNYNLQGDDVSAAKPESSTVNTVESIAGAESAVDTAISAANTTESIARAESSVAGVQKNAAQGNTEQSVKRTEYGEFVAAVSDDILKNTDPVLWSEEDKEKAIIAAREALAKFGEIVVYDITDNQFGNICRVSTEQMRSGKLLPMTSSNYKGVGIGDVLMGAGKNQYSVSVYVGKTQTGDNVFCGVRDIKPTQFTTIKEELSPNVTTNKSPDAAYESSSTDNVAQQGVDVKQNVRYSSRVDSTGKELSEGQVAYFANSEVRDEDGNLIPVYHSTDDEFYTFDRNKLGRTTLKNATDASIASTSLIGHWFSDHDLSDAMGGKAMQAYLNIEYPYTIDLDTLAAEISNYANDPEQMQDDFDFGDYTQTRQAANRFTEWLREEGYDGLIVADTEFGGTSYVVLDSDQAKLTTNKAPTKSGDTRFSIRKTRNMNWDEQIKGALYGNGNITRNDTLIVGEVAGYLTQEGIEQKPLAIPLSVLSKASSGKDISHSIKKGKLAKLDSGIENAPITIVNPARNAIVFVTDIKQGGAPILAAFDRNATFDGDDVHKATSIHLQMDVQSLLENLPASATVYIKSKNELAAVGATNNLRGLAANVKFISGDTITESGTDVKKKLRYSSRQSQEVKQALEDYRYQRDVEFKAMKAVYDAERRQIEQAHRMEMNLNSRDFYHIHPARSFVFADFMLY